MEQNSEIAAINTAIKSIGERLESNYLSKSEYTSEAKKLADAVAALSKEMDNKRLAEKTNPVFGDMKTAQSFIDCMKGALANSDVPNFRNVTADKASPFYVSKADLNSYGTGTGLETVPTAVSDVFSYLLAQGGVARQNATVLNGLVGNITLTKRNGTSTAAFTVATTNKDDTAVSPGAFGTSSVTLSPQQISALSLVSDKLLYSSAINVAEMVGIDLVEQAAVLEDNAVLKGDGTAAFGLTTGIVSQATAISLANASFTSLDKILDLPGQVHESVYGSPNACYFMSGAILQKIRQFKASTAGSYFLDPTTGQFNLGGYPIKVWHRMDNTIATGKNVVLFGDMHKAVTIGVGRDMKLEVSRDYKFNTNQVAFRLSYDFHAVAIQPTAMSVLSLT